MNRLPQSAVTIAAYLGGVATILVLQAIQPDTKVVMVPEAANILARPPTTADHKQPSPQPITIPTVTVASCTRDMDCLSPTAICASKYTLCEEMRNPICSCSQPQVLRCSDAANRSKHTFCPNGCEAAGNGARCL